MPKQEDIFYAIITLSSENDTFDKKGIRGAFVSFIGSSFLLHFVDL